MSSCKTNTVGKYVGIPSETMRSDSAFLPWKHWRWSYWEPPESARKTDATLSPWTHRRRVQQPPSNCRKRRRTIWDNEDRCVCVCVCTCVSVSITWRGRKAVLSCTTLWTHKEGQSHTDGLSHISVCVCVCVCRTEVNAVLGPAPLFRDPPPAPTMLIGCKWADKVRPQWPELPPQMDDW